MVSSSSRLSTSHVSARYSGQLHPSRPRAVTAAPRAIAAYLALWAAAPALAQPVPPPRGSVSPDGDYAYSGTFSYDPSTCSRDPGGMVYFAVGRRVLRQPLDNLGRMMGLSAAEQRVMPHVRHPEEPVGCPDHPIQMAVYNLWRVSAMPGDPSSPVAVDADAISAIIHDGDVPARRNNLFQLLCKGMERDTSKVPGFVACEKPKSCYTSGVYEATDYTEPNGTKVALMCDVGPGCSAERGHCEGGYLLREHFTVNLAFGVSRLPIARFPVADQELRRRLDAAEVRNFEWAKEPAVDTSGDK